MATLAAGRAHTTSADPPLSTGSIAEPGAAAETPHAVVADLAQADNGPSADVEPTPVSIDVANSTPSLDPTLAPTAPFATSPSLASSSPAASATVTTLAAAIVSRANQPATRFDVVLDPAGLGRVTVRLEIAANGRLSAALTFEKSDTATALGARSQELHAALAKAGFDVGADAISFDASPAAASSGSGGGPAQDGSSSGGRPSPTPSRAPSFTEARFEDFSSPVAYGGSTAAGYDIRV